MVSTRSCVLVDRCASRSGKWLPEDIRILREWLRDVIEYVEMHPRELHPVIKEFRTMIEEDGRIYLLFASMFNQIPNKHPYNEDPTGCPQVRDCDHMLRLLNHTLSTAPCWSATSEHVGLVGVPINALLEWAMGTKSGFAAFLDERVNGMLRKVLNAWAKFLESPDSAYVLQDHETGWFSEHAKREIEKTANMGSSSHSFEELFVCDPSAPHHGYRSWDNFFTRSFRPGIRPVAAPNDGAIIVSACESTPYQVAYQVRAREKFWTKGCLYSVSDMLAHDELAAPFEEGTVYQAYLNALSYHRWHSPVSGHIIKAYVRGGTYYSEALFADLDGTPGGANKDGEGAGQSYLAHMAARVIMFIEADNADIGLMAFIGIGMGEVSSCDITVYEGQHVQKGDQIGMFHYGGSTYCLLFRKGVMVGGFPNPGRQQNVPVCSALATVSSGQGSVRRTT